MKNWRCAVSALALLATACGGDGDNIGGVGGGGTAVTPTPVAPPTTACALRERQNFAFTTLRDTYLFPETLPASLDPTPFSSVQTYIDALTATARSQRRDRFFTYITSIAEENAFFQSGSTAGFGIRLSNMDNRVLIAEAFEGAPALAAGIDRGDEITAIGTNANNLRTVADIIAADGPAGVNGALGPNDPGVTRTLRVTGPSGTRVLTVTKADFALTPVSSRYGAQIIDDGGKKVGYLNLRTFISTADPALRTAFNNFQTAGITEFVIDFRYNGGGLVSTADLMNNLLGGNRSTSDVASITQFRPELASNNSTRHFQPQPESVSPVKIAFIGTGATASASELVINAFIPYLGVNEALIGANTFGKPVGQIAVDRAACDDRIRVVAFTTKNAANSDAYFDGLATAVSRTCAAGDDLTRPLGNPQEASTKAALDFLAGRQCTPITAGAQQSQSVSTTRPQMMTPTAPDVAQREVPGFF